MQLLLRSTLGLLAAAPALLAQVTLTFTPTKDNTLYEDPTGSVSNGAGQHLFCGSSAAGSKRRGLLLFDVAARIPARSQVLSAALTLHVSLTSTGAVPIALHRAGASWGEGTSAAVGTEESGAPATSGDATWLHRTYNSSFWRVPGGEYDLAPLGSVYVDGPGYYTWPSSAATVTEVQGWVNTPASNNGWMLLAYEFPQSSKRFDSRENAVPPARPQLVVTFLPGASVVNVGSGCTGSSAGPLSLAAPVPGLGLQAFALSLTKGPVSALAAFFYATRVGTPLPINASLPACLYQLDPAAHLLTVPATLSVTGAATLPMPIPNEPTLAGYVLATQVVVADTLAPGLLTASNALVLTIGKYP